MKQNALICFAQLLAPRAPIIDDKVKLDFMRGMPPAYQTSINLLR